MTRHLRIKILTLITLAVSTTTLQAASQAEYDHDRFVTQPTEAVREFRAFKLSFDTDADGVALGVPDWVAYELRRDPSPDGKSHPRPSRWTTDPDLHRQGIAPDDSSYRHSGYSRGHMCMKSHAGRIGPTADRETHTVLNACPQVQSMNGGIWLAIENLTGRWADQHDVVWIVTGPVFTGDTRTWIGDPGEVPVAVPDAFYKLAIRDDGENIHVLSFLVPMQGDKNHSRSNADVTPYLTSVDNIESLTGLDFLTSLPDTEEARLERHIPRKLWGSLPGPTTAKPAQTRQELPTLSDSPAPDQDGPVSLRSGRSVSDADRAIATELATRGWTYVMPRPKSSKAAWGNTDRRTTWWAGYWMKERTRQTSTRQPNPADGFKGDGETPGWRSGGTPKHPTDVEWLCSESGGPPV